MPPKEETNPKATGTNVGAIDPDLDMPGLMTGLRAVMSSYLVQCHQSQAWWEAMRRYQPRLAGPLRYVTDMERLDLSPRRCHGGSLRDNYQRDG